MKKRIARLIVFVGLKWRPGFWWVLVHRVDQKGGHLDRADRRWLPLFRWAINNVETDTLSNRVLKTWFDRPME